MKKHFLLLWLLLFGSIGLAMAQSRQIQGVVKSAEGEPLPGVTVLVEGTTNGSSTGGDGAYSITLPAASAATAKLRFSYVGFTSKEVTVGDQSTINVTLASDSKQLEDVVVIGYQQVQRRDVTGSVSSVGAQQIKDIPVNSAAEALTGRLAGVQLTSAEGTPGNNNVQVRVRGGGSITQDNSPLYVVDGIQIENALSVIAPQDIASVDVLKDASSTAIYGARGANGVVIITTKSGKEGRTSVSYNGFAGFRRLSKKLDVMGPADYLNWEYERALLTGTGAGVSGGTSTFKALFGSTNFASDTLNRIRKAPFQDWQDQVFGRDAFQQTHNVSVNGGNKATTYALSLTSNKEDGIQLGSSYERKLVNFRLDTKATDRLRLGVNVRFNDQRNNGAGTGAALGNSSTGQTVNTGSSVTSRLRNTVQYQPFITPALNGSAGIDPTTTFDPDFFANSTLINPVLANNNEYRADKRRTFNMGGTAAFDIAKNLTFRSTGGFDITYADLGTFNGLYSPTIRQAAGGYQNLPFATIATGTTTTINNSNVLDYTFKKEAHTLNVLLGEETYQQRTTTAFTQVNFLPADITAERALANLNQAVLPVGTVSQPVLPQTGVPVDYRLLSGFGRLNYSYEDKYLLTVSSRLDGSSKFKPGHRARVFPGVSAAWRISKEDFFQLPAISDLKLRLSYGQAGNNRIADFLGDQLFQAGNVSYVLNHVTTPATSATNLANPDLQWEVTTTRNAGIDLALFNNRVQFTADAYYNTTNDLLVNVPIPGFTGYTSQLQNVGSTSNRGLELQLSGTVIQTPDFTWSATANAALNRGRIESLGSGAQEIQSIQSGWAGSALSGADYVARVGSPVGQMFGFITDGFYTADDFETYNYATRTGVLKKTVASDASVTGTAISLGSIKLKDTNGDGTVTDADKTVIGNANPKLTGGLNQQFTYKGFDASVFLNFVLGNDIYNANKIEFTTSTANTSYANLLSVMNNRVKNIDENGVLIADAATFNRVNANASIWSPVRGNYFLHSYAVEDGSFLRVNNITLGYSLPKALISKGKLNQLRFYVTLNNLYTFTKYTGYDPEVNTRRGTPLTPGVDYAAYPRSRAFLFGVNIGL
ncbi:TonB-dependent receptor [Hymenobacter sp. BT770]|uniref:SusC/RagA family TonB-linked outer membrane protein n=1 Tax=Hymenobacter sp. BT770 TaxID=2886942 RepID=UPI001D126E1A|nr:TonB-dependent receptor [Hymenobacter sp. BT770]MCC3154818.1 TonB-dependent receptor [Hymenobacter sp. BT770]MDO3416807.1 TonB-dependent receptor [Hymenobacter sp. BT770]